jgi:hypothetical protein
MQENRQRLENKSPDGILLRPSPCQHGSPESLFCRAGTKVNVVTFCDSGTRVPKIPIRLRAGYHMLPRIPNALICRLPVYRSPIGCRFYPAGRQQTARVILICLSFDSP